MSDALASGAVTVWFNAGAHASEGDRIPHPLAPFLAPTASQVTRVKSSA
jgi:hypothetical protein